MDHFRNHFAGRVFRVCKKYAEQPVRWWDMTAVKHWLGTWPVFLTLVAGLAAYTVVHTLPASLWLEVNSVMVGPARVGRPVPILLDRSINRQFHGSWLVIVKRLEPTGAVPHCEAGGTTWYEPDAALPQTPTLQWWTKGVCPTLPLGSFYVDVVWRIKPPVSWLPEKVVHARSNIFEVTP